MTEEKDTVSVVGEYEIGDRIEYLSHYGTVKYIGEVEGYSSTWLGVDWDDPSRGKHDGTVNGKHYFNSSATTSGSFIRPGKLKPGIDAITAITSRYGKRSSSNELITKQQLSNLQREMNAPFISMVGFDKVNEKQSNFKDLKVVSLRLQRVSSPGADGKLLEICPNITELDLSKNLFNNWKDIMIICNQLVNLHWLCISENLLEFNVDPSEYQFSNLKTIICGFMKLSWEDILQITQIFVNLQELRIPFNMISCISIPEEHHLSNINLIDLEGNEIGDWNEINKLGFLPYLEQLNVRNTSIQNIELKECGDDGKASIFKSLKQLIISENRIDNWESISELNKLQCLEDLRFLKNPILETENAATSFQLTVARLSKLTILNGTIIKLDDRKGAEYDYIKKQGLEWLKAKNNESLKNEFLRKHPRYLELITKYGEPEESELVTNLPSLKSSLTNVEICYNDRIISKKLPSTMMLQKLIMLVQKLFNLPDRPILYYTSSDRPDMEIEMDDEFKEIGFYSLQNGDKIFVRL